MTDHRPSIAIVTSRFPFPIEKGDKLRLYHQIKYISKYYDIYLFSLTDQSIPPQDFAEIQQFCKGIKIYQDQKWKRYWRVLSGFFNDLPSQINYFYSKPLHQALVKDLIVVNPDVVFCQLYRMAPYISNLTAPKVLDIMDAFSTIANLQSQHARHPLEKWFWTKEEKLLKQYEQSIQGEFEGFTIISERDAKALHQIPKEKLKVVRNGIDIEYFQAQDFRLPSENYDVAFIGNFNYRPNQEAVRYIQDEIWPYFKKNSVNLRILIGGNGADQWKTKESHPSIHYHGWYDDIREAYYASKIFIAPLFLGSGMQNKVLEALACNRQVICSSHVIQAMPMLTSYVYTADSPEEYYKAFKKILNSQDEITEQNQSLDVLKTELTWEIQCGNLKLLLDDARENYQWDFDRYH